MASGKVHKLCVVLGLPKAEDLCLYTCTFIIMSKTFLVELLMMELTSLPAGKGAIRI